MRDVSLTGVSLASVLAIFVPFVLGGAVADAAGPSPDCPSAHGQRVPFDQTTVTFDSVAATLDAETAQVTYCVRVSDAPHEYLVDWGDVNVKDVFTHDGFLSASRTFSGKLTIGSSTVYFGANRTDFQVGILREETIVGALTGKIIEGISSFHGSVSMLPVDRPEPERREKLQVANVQVSFKLDNSQVQFVAVDLAEGSRASLLLATPIELTRANNEIPSEIQLEPKGRPYFYQVDPNFAVLRRVAVTLRNSDHKDVGTIPVTLLTDKRQ
jgi:hypothetical protein